MDKTAALQKISQEIENCQICQKDSSGLPVPGEGSPDAKVVFIGEAPGKTEAKTGRPFVGRSGQLLRKLITEIGLTESEVFITSIFKYLPNSGKPTSQQIEHGLIHTRKQLEIIKPKIIVLLGGVASSLIGNLPVVSNHGKTIVQDKTTYFITLHPSAALRFQKNLIILKADFQKLKSLL